MVIEHDAFNYLSKKLLVCCQVNTRHVCKFFFVGSERFIHNWVAKAKTSISTDLDIHTDKLGV